MRKRTPSNRNAVVRTRIDRTGKIRTETARRDSGFDVAITTHRRNNSTRVFIDMEGRAGRSFGSLGPNARGKLVELDGHQARTLLRILMKHFDVQGKLP